MEYDQLRQNLEKILNDDLHNRVSIQEMRRDVFLNSENLQRVQQTIDEKEKLIVGLRTVGERETQKISQLSAELEEIKNLMEWERTQHVQEREGFQLELQKRDEELLSLREELNSSAKDNAEITRLSIQNNEYAAKIRELIYHIDGLNNQLEESKKTEASRENLETQMLQLKSELDLMAEKLATANERNSLLSSQYQEIQLLLDAANQENSSVKKENQEIKANYDETLQNWIQQKQLVDEDNVSLSGANELLKLEISDTLIKYNGAIAELERLQKSLHEAEGLLSEKNEAGNLHAMELEQLLENLKHENSQLQSSIESQKESSATELRQVNVFFENQVSQLKSEMDSLKLDYSNLEFERAQLLIKLDDLNAQMTEKKEETPAETQNDGFIDKLFLQIDELTASKLNLQEELEHKLQQMGDLQGKLEEFKETIGNQSIAIENLEKQRNQVNLAETLFPGMQPEAIKNKIDELVREIDRCLSLLNA